MQHLPGNEVLYVVRLSDAFTNRKVGILGRQSAKEAANCGGAAVGKSQLGILRVELKRVTNLALAKKRDAFVIATGRVGVVAIDAIQSMTVNPGDICRKMAFVIEPKHVRVARRLAFELELRMTVPERGESSGIAIAWSRQIKDYLLRWVGMALKTGPAEQMAFRR